MNKRHSEIIEIVNNSTKIDVNTLSQMIGVSPVTIRKDLDHLEKMKLLTREHGYAVKCNEENINNRLAYKHEVKIKIATKAADLVAVRETIMIESGSSCTLLASVLSKSNKDVTIITNSAFIANYLRDESGVNIILLGGQYQKEAQVMVGPLIKSCVKEFNVDKLFLGVDGFNPDFGFTGNDLMRTDAMKTMSESAKDIYILTDSSKFYKKGVVSQLPFSDVYAVVTDKDIPKSAKDIIEGKGIKVIIASDT